MLDLKDLAIKLFDINVIKFGKFKLKSGLLSPVYFDLRVLIAYPKLMNEISQLFYETAIKKSSKFTQVCGVPYTALPIATLISTNNYIPMVIKRKEAKDYGTSKYIEGIFNRDEVCLIIEDTVTTGSSILDTKKSLEEVGLIVHDAVVLLDREQGASENLKISGVNIHSLLNVKQLMIYLYESSKIDKNILDSVLNFTNENKCVIKSSIVLDYESRAKLCSHPISKKLFQLMSEKRSNLILSADVNSSKELLMLADLIGPYIVVLKTHIDIVNDFEESLPTKLREIAEKHKFLVFEDRKFADLGNTVRQQFEGGVFKISKWADIINAHPLPGPGILTGLKEANKNIACLLIAEMSSEGNLISSDYTKSTIELAKKNKDFVIGFISTKKISDDPELIHFTPGVNLACKGDGIGQQYLTPREVITNLKSDLIIVGRGIIKSSNPLKTAIQYQKEGFAAYEELLKS